MWKFKYKYLVFLVEFCVIFLQEQYLQELLVELFIYLERCWIEIEDFYILVIVMMKVGYFLELLMNCLEDKCLELVEYFGFNELWKVLVMLVVQSWWFVFLLWVIFYYLVQKFFFLMKDVFLDVVYVYGKFSFYQIQVFQCLVIDLLFFMFSLIFGEVVYCVKFFVLFKWFSLFLFEVFVQYVLNRVQDIILFYLCSVFLVFVCLNFYLD